MKSIDSVLLACAVAALSFGGLASTDALGRVAASERCDKKKCVSDNEQNTFGCANSDGTDSCPTVQIIASNQHCTDGGGWDSCTERYDPNAPHYTKTTYGAVAQVTTWTAVCSNGSGGGATFNATTLQGLQAQLQAGGYTENQCRITSNTTCNCSAPTTTIVNGRTRC
jgi:hypothetical protein